MSAYTDAVTAINMIATDSRPTVVRQELTALKALIELQMEKLPPDKPDYDTEESSDAS